MDVLEDLQTLSSFVGTRVPISSPNSQLLPLLVHPVHTTFPWAPLRTALESYFGTPTTIDPARVQGGWAGLKCYIAAFKRLEAVDSEGETAEVMTWLLSLKDAAIQNSIFCKAPETDMLYDVLAGLHNPITAEQLPAMTERARYVTSIPGSGPAEESSTAAGPGWQLAGSTSFERGVLVQASPNARLVPTSLSTAAGNARTEKPTPKKRTLGVAVANGGNKRRRSGSLEPLSAVGARARDSTVSTSALSSFADFSDRAEDRDEEEEEEEEEEEDEEDDLEGSIASSTSSRNYVPNSHSTTTTTTTRSPPKPAAGGLGGTSQKIKQEMIAQRLSTVTGVNFGKCCDVVGRISKTELETLLDPTLPLPVHLLAMAQAAPPYSTASQPSHKKSVKRDSYDNDVGGVGGKKVVRSHDPNRPAFSYSALIGQAILSTSLKRMRLAEIYDYVTAHYPYYTKNECGWQNSIRHNLSLQPVFTKIPDLSAPGKKGCHWMILEREEWRFDGGGWKKIDGKEKKAAKKEAKEAKELGGVKKKGKKAVAGGLLGKGKKVGKVREEVEELEGDEGELEKGEEEEVEKVEGENGTVVLKSEEKSIGGKKEEEQQALQEESMVEEEEVEEEKDEILSDLD